MTTNPFRWVGYNGYYWDEDVEEYWILIRPYAPILARWLTFDPLGFEAGDENWYRYVLNNAINAIDPSGMTRRCTLAHPLEVYYGSTTKPTGKEKGTSLIYWEKKKGHH